MSLGKIKVGTAFSKSYTHNLDFDNNTTMDFGTVQPLLCQYLFPRSDVKLNYRQLVRLAPMPTPSFARLFVKNYVRFVNLADVVPYHEALLAGKPFFADNRSFVPRKLPFTCSRLLQYFLLQHSMYTIYGANSDYSYSRLVADISSTSEQYNLILSMFYAYLGIGSSPNKDYMKLPASNDSTHFPSLGNVSFFDADYIVPVYNTLTDATSPFGFICFKYSNFARNLRKQFVGLGYGLQLEDNTPVSFAPLLAFYKTYFDTFGLTRVTSFESTSCYALIRLISNYEIDFSLEMFTQVDPTILVPNRHSLFISFMNDLASMYYTSSNNFIAAHREKPNNYTYMPLGGKNFLEANGSTDNNLIGNGVADYQPQLNSAALSNGSTSFTQLSLDLLKRITRFVAKDSAIGYRISDWVKVHFGADVVNSLFEDSNFISESTTPVDISDVFSTSDTANVGTENKGDYLGAYAGKGIGFNKNSCSFHSRYHGYLFMFSVIVPSVRDFVGTDPTLYAIDKDTIPVPDFDALGMELTPRGALIGDNFIASKRGEFTNKSFGFVPRYSAFKVKKDVVNGDMYLGHFKRDLQPYYLDRIPYNNFIENVVQEINGLIHVNGLTFGNSPNSSTNWQVLDGKTNIGNFNRLFYDEGNISSDYNKPENFIVQTVFDFKVKNFLRPISESYETFDDSNDSSSTNVTTN